MTWSRCESENRSSGSSWFLFNRRENVSSKSSRSKRTTKAGYWKATGKDRDVKIKGTNRVIGTKKTLVFHTGRVPHGVKTNWVIHEYHALDFPLPERTFVVYRLKRNTEIGEEDKKKATVPNRKCWDISYPRWQQAEQVITSSFLIANDPFGTRRVLFCFQVKVIKEIFFSFAEIKLLFHEYERNMNPELFAWL